MPRRYGRKGFTQKKVIRELLEPFEQPGASSEAPVRIVNMPAAQAAELLAEMPAPQKDDRACDGAPTFREIVELGISLRGAVLQGVRVPPDDVGERVTFTGLTVPHDAVDHEVVQLLLQASRDPSAVAVGANGSVSAAWEVQ
jgi:hypothetical protein